MNVITAQRRGACGCVTRAFLTEGEHTVTHIGKLGTASLLSAEVT